MNKKIDDNRTMTYRRVIFDPEQNKKGNSKFRALQEIKLSRHKMLNSFLECVMSDYGKFQFDDKDLEIQFAKLNAEMHNTRNMLIDKNFIKGFKIENTNDENE